MISRARRVLEVLRESPTPLTAVQVASVLGEDKHVVANALSKLQRRTAVRKVAGTLGWEAIEPVRNCPRNAWANPMPGVLENAVRWVQGVSHDWYHCAVCGASVGSRETCAAHPSAGVVQG